MQDRGLVVTDLKAKDIILEHKSYCAKKARERYFLGNVLGYITPVSTEKFDIDDLHVSFLVHSGVVVVFANKDVNSSPKLGILSSCFLHIV